MSTNALEKFGRDFLQKIVARVPAVHVISDEYEYVLPEVWTQYERFYAAYRGEFSTDGQSVEQAPPRLWVWSMLQGLKQVTDLAAWQLESAPNDAGDTRNLASACEYILGQLQSPDICNVGRDLFVIVHPKAALASSSVAALAMEEVLREMDASEGPVRIVITGLTGELPPMLANFASIIDFPYPDHDIIRDVLSRNGRDKHPDFAAPKEVPAQFVNAVAGLSWRPLATTAREVAVRLTDPDAAHAHAQAAKVAAVRSVAPFVRLEPALTEEPPLVGLETLKQWADETKQVFNNPSAGVSAGGGYLLVGPPGTGKSAFIRYLSWQLGLPVLWHNFGSMMNSLIGSSEERTDRVHKMSRAMGAHIYAMDEVEKQTPALRSGATDGGVGARLLSQQLTFIQEVWDQGLPIIFVGTANMTNLDNLPPEFFNRFPMVGYVDYPSREALAGIFQAHLGLIGDGDFDCGALASTLVGAMGGNVKTLQGKTIQGERRAVGRDVVQIIRAAQRKAAQRGSNFPAYDELLATINEMRTGTVALDDKGYILAKLAGAQDNQPSARHKSGGDGLVVLNN